MTINKTLEALKGVIEGANAATFPNLQNLPVHLPQEDETREIYPCIMLKDQGAEYDEVLRGVINPLTVSVELHSIPHDDGESGTSEATHRQIEEELYCLLGDVTNTINNLNAFGSVKVFDLWGMLEGNERDDGRNTSLISLEIVVCPNY